MVPRAVSKCNFLKRLLTNKLTATKMPDEFPYDVFLSHSSKDKAVVRPLAERTLNN